MSYEQKLMQMKKLLKKADAADPIDPNPQVKQPEAPWYEDQWLAAGLLKETNKHGVVYKRVVEYPVNYQHGNIALSGLKKALDAWVSSGEIHPMAAKPTNRIVFFDTETTGLKGAGTLIFLMGFIEETERSFKLTQLLLPGPDHEAAFLFASGLWENPLTLVTYNGKSFDIPQVETRWTMNRNTLPPLLKHSHIDLLHGARRIWKDEIARFRLPVIEEEQLGFIRDGDIPGHMAPIIYQDSVKNGRPEMLMKVIKHNEWDILSLVALYIHSTKLILENEYIHTPISQANVGKWFADLKSYDRSKAILESSIAEYGLHHPITYFHLGYILKREKDFMKALAMFTVAAEQLDGRERIVALEELAKLYEHRVKELEKALEVTLRGQKQLKEDHRLTERFRIRSGNDFKKREIRLRGKLFPGEAHETTKTLRSSD